MPELFSYWAEPDLGRRFCREPQRGGGGRWPRPRPTAWSGWAPCRCRTSTAAIADGRRGPRAGPAGIEIGSNVLGTVTGAVQLPALLPGRGRRRVSASSSTRSTRRTGTASPIRRWPRRSTSRRDRHEHGRDGGERVRRAEPRPPPLRQPRRRHAAAAPAADAGVLGRRSGPRRAGGRRTRRCGRMWFDSLTYEPAALRSTDRPRRRRRAWSSAPTHRSSPSHPGYVVDQLHEHRPARRPRTLGDDPYHQRGRVPRSPARTRRSSMSDPSRPQHRRHDDARADDLGRRPRGRTARRLDQPAAREVAGRVPARGRGGRQDRLALRAEAEVARRARRPPVRSRVGQARPHRLPGALRGPAARVLPARGAGGAISTSPASSASLCFPAFPRFCGQEFTEASDRELGLACVRAYNDWMIDEWCGAVPGRLIPLVILPLWDADLAVAEVERCAAKGARAVTFSENPAALGLPSVHDRRQYWDPVFAACADERHAGVHPHRVVVEAAVHVRRRPAAGRGDAAVEPGRVRRWPTGSTAGCSSATRRSSSACRRAGSAGSRRSSNGPTTCSSATRRG